MTVTFKCIKTGNTVDFLTEHDIQSMRKHPEYTEVETTVEEPVKQRGRPKKIVEDTDTDSI